MHGAEFCFIDVEEFLDMATAGFVHQCVAARVVGQHTLQLPVMDSKSKQLCRSISSLFIFYLQSIFLLRTKMAYALKDAPL